MISTAPSSECSPAWNPASPPGGWLPWWYSCRRHHWWWSQCAENMSRLLPAFILKCSFLFEICFRLWTSKPEMNNRQGRICTVLYIFRGSWYQSRVRPGWTAISTTSNPSFTKQRKIIRTYYSDSIICFSTCTYRIFKLKVTNNLGWREIFWLFLLYL